MKRIAAVFILACATLLCQAVFAQATKGTLVSVSGSGEIRADNDQADVSFFIEEQDRDKAAAASRVNQKMKQGTELLKKLDPEGKYATRGYYSYPVYAEPTSGNKARTLTGWRVGQYLDMTTGNLEQLPANVAAVQQILALNGIRFGLSEELIKKLEAKRINAAYANLQERVQIIARAMGRDLTDAVFEALEVDGSNANFQPVGRMFAAAAPVAKGNAVQETSFEPGETTLSAHIVAKVKFN